jgi:hypothetical protein
MEMLNTFAIHEMCTLLVALFDTTGVQGKMYYKIKEIFNWGARTLRSITSLSKIPVIFGFVLKTTVDCRTIVVIILV